MVKHTIQIVIVDDSKGEKCDAHCGVDWSSAEVIDLARQRIKERFGEGIQLKYLDLSKPMIDHPTSKSNQAIRNRNLSLPVLLINGEPRISGEFDIRMLLDAIDTEIEINYE